MAVKKRKDWFLFNAIKSAVRFFYPKMNIVGIENIFRLRRMGVPAKKAAVAGAKQVAAAITSSTLTTVCVFVPMLLCFLAPIIVVLLVIRYFMRRHKDSVRLTEMAMEKGEPFSDELKPLSKKSPEYMWRRGVRNTSIGAGLMIFFWFFSMQSFMGIGALVACIGLGQMFMVKYNYDSKMPWQKRDDEDETDH